MKVTELAALRDQWYALARVEELRCGVPLRARLLGEEYTLWAPDGGGPVLTEAFCPHRGARLSAGTVQGDKLVCRYHGWEYASSGLCTRVPQLEPGLPVPPKARTSTWPVVERYGLCWACVGDPSSDGPPPWREADELGWRVQVDFLEPWAASALRIIDNNLDISHPAFVHQGTFGDPTRPLVAPYEIERTPAGYRANVPQDVGGVGPQLGVANEGRRFERTQETELLGPVHTRIRLNYGGAAADYCFYGSATPLDDENSLYVRVSALAGTEQEQPYPMFWDFSRRVTLEDKVVLEDTDPDFPLEVTREVHLRCDKVTLEYRRYLARLAGGSGGVPDLSAAARSTGAVPPDLGQPEGGRSEPAA